MIDTRLPVLATIAVIDPPSNKSDEKPVAGVKCHFGGYVVRDHRGQRRFFYLLS